MTKKIFYLFLLILPFGINAQENCNCFSVYFTGPDEVCGTYNPGWHDYDYEAKISGSGCIGTGQITLNIRLEGEGIILESSSSQATLSTHYSGTGIHTIPFTVRWFKEYHVPARPKQHDVKISADGYYTYHDQSGTFGSFEICTIDKTISYNITVDPHPSAPTIDFQDENITQTYFVVYGNGRILSRYNGAIVGQDIIIKADAPVQAFDYWWNPGQNLENHAYSRQTGFDEFTISPWDGIQYNFNPLYVQYRDANCRQFSLPHLTYIRISEAYQVPWREENTLDVATTIYPNPTSNTLNIDLPIPPEEAQKIRIYSNTAIIQEQVITSSNFAIDTQKYPNGTYYLEIVYKDKEPTIKKFVVNH